MTANPVVGPQKARPPRTAEHTPCRHTPGGFALLPGLTEALNVSNRNSTLPRAIAPSDALFDAVWSSAVREVIIDNNAIEPFADVTGAYEAAQDAIKCGDLRISYIYTTLNEAAATPDLDRRTRKLLILIGLGNLVPQVASCSMNSGSTGRLSAMSWRCRSRCPLKWKPQ